MKAAPWLVLCIFLMILSTSCFVFWLFVNIQFEQSLLNGLWMPIAGIIVEGLSFGAYYNYRLIREVNKSRRSDSKGSGHAL